MYASMEDVIFQGQYSVENDKFLQSMTNIRMKDNRNQHKRTLSC